MTKPIRDHERDDEVARLYDLMNWSFSKIAKHYGWRSKVSAHKAYHRAKKRAEIIAPSLSTE